MALEIVDERSGDPAGDDQESAQPKGPRAEEIEIVVNGKREKFDVSNAEHRQELIRRAQLGTNYSDKAEALNAKEADLMRRFRPYQEFDVILQQDKELEDFVTRRLRGEPVEFPGTRRPPNGGKRPAAEDDEPGDREDLETQIAETERALRRDLGAKEQGLTRILGRLNERLDALDQRDQDRVEEARLKTHPLFKGWITDDHIAAAKEARRTRGGNLTDNFKILFFDQIPAIVERRVRNEIPPELRRTLLTRETGPIVVDGETLTEERLQQLRDDPDEYAKVRAKLRASRRKRTGKLPYPGRA